MTQEDWFDDLCRTMRGISRREIALASATFVTGPLMGAFASSVAAGNKRKKKGKKGKGKGKGNGKKPNKPNKPSKPKPPAEPDICDTTWPGEDQQEDRDWCRFIRRQCPPGGSRDFCIIELELDKAAYCCEEGSTCCGGWCCAADEQCREHQCVCEAPDCARACSDDDCQQGQSCVDGEGNYCHGQSGSDCRCGCPGTYKPCFIPDLGWVCASPEAVC